MELDQDFRVQDGRINDSRCTSHFVCGGCELGVQSGYKPVGSVASFWKLDAAF